MFVDILYPFRIVSHQISSRIKNTFMMPHPCHRFSWRCHTIHADDDYDNGLDDEGNDNGKTMIMMMMMMPAPLS